MNPPFNRILRCRICLAVALAMALAATTGLAQAPVDPIDERLQAALEQDPSTADQLAAIAAARAAWDARLNAVYRELLASLSPDAAAALRTSQRAWLAFRDAEERALDALYANTEGTLFLPLRADDGVDLLRHRVRDLEGWRDLWQLRNQ